MHYSHFLEKSKMFALIAIFAIALSPLAIVKAEEQDASTTSDTQEQAESVQSDTTSDDVSLNSSQDHSHDNDEDEDNHDGDNHDDHDEDQDNDHDDDGDNNHDDDDEDQDNDHDDDDEDQDNDHDDDGEDQDNDHDDDGDHNHDGDNNGDNDNEAGEINFKKFSCPEGTEITDANAVNDNGTYAVPAGCVPQAGAQYGYIYEPNRSDIGDPSTGLDDDTPFTIIGITDANGVLIFTGAYSTGRYDVAEVHSDGSYDAQNDSTRTTRLFCTGDNLYEDNYENVLVQPNETAHCVGYSKVLATTTPPDDGGGTGTTTPPTDGGGSGSGGGGGGGGLYNGGGVANNGGVATTTGSVLGASTTPSSLCPANGLYLKHYVKFGFANDYESVIKLQVFLNKNQGNNLVYTGVYDNATRDAVNAFQVKYNIEVLKPWYDIGLLPTPTTATGYVYKTTSRQINNLVCPGLNLPIPPLP